MPRTRSVANLRNKYNKIFELCHISSETHIGKKPFFSKLILFFFLLPSFAFSTEIPLSVANLQQIRSALVQQAERYQGAPYRYGGTGSNGFDCSGLVYRVYHQITKIALPRSARALSTTGIPIESDKLAAGDILFFETMGNGISHAGIYDGKGGVIHAASAGPRQGVIRSQLSQNYYKNSYVSARRIVVSSRKSKESSRTVPPPPIRNKPFFIVWGKHHLGR